MCKWIAGTGYRCSCSLISSDVTRVNTNVAPGTLSAWMWHQPTFLSKVCFSYRACLHSISTGSHQPIDGSRNRVDRLGDYHTFLWWCRWWQTLLDSLRRKSFGLDNKMWRYLHLCSCSRYLLIFTGPVTVPTRSVSTFHFKWLLFHMFFWFSCWLTR